MARKYRATEVYVFDESLGKYVWKKVEGARPTKRGVAKWPMTSISMAVKPHEAEAYQKDATDNGFTGITFGRDGSLTIDSPAQRRQYSQHRGLIDRSSYGGRL